MLGRGIDVRGNGGFILVPPSKTIRDYQFLLDPINTPLEQCPEWILKKIISITISRHLPAGLRVGAEVPQGVRHQSLLTLAGAMRRIGMNNEEMMTSLAIMRDSRFDAGDHAVPDNEISDIVDWVSQKKRSFACTDIGNGERFVTIFGNSVKYCYEFNA